LSRENVIGTPNVPFFLKRFPFLFILSILITKTPCKDISCMDINNLIKEQPNFLEEIQPSNKYDKDISSVRPGPAAQ
jgi:hypothetical protein